MTSTHQNNATDPVNAALNYGYGFLKGLAQFKQHYKRFPTIGMKVDVATDENRYWKIAL